MKDDAYWMGIALREADKAADMGEVPVGAVVVQGGRAVGRGYNRREKAHDPTAHAEIIAIRKAALKVGNWRLTDATLYVTLEPCLMCMGAILLARLQRVVFGCYDPKAGAAGSLYDLSNDWRLNHRLAVVSGVMETECAERLSRFFTALRSMKQDLKDQVRRDVRVVDGS
ncbi:MAG: tRNA adenosine(34) deaminase TadA [Geobacteraceae bacterium]